MRIISTFVLGSTLAIGTVVGLAPASQAAPMKLGPVGPGVTVTPVTPTNPCIIKVCKPPIVKIDPCVVKPELCKLTPTDPKDPKGPKDPKPEDPAPPPPADVPVKGRPVFTG